jgi:hypothetical protein
VNRQITIGRFDSRTTFHEGAEILMDEAIRALGTCYEQALRSFESVEEALANTYMCLSTAGSQLEFSVHSPKKATVSFRSEEVTRPRWFGLLHLPYETEMTVTCEQEAREILRKYFEATDDEMVSGLEQRDRR